MKKLFLLLLLVLSSCQDDPITPNPTPILTYQAQIRAHCDQSLIYVNGVQYGIGIEITMLEKDLKTGDTVRLYGCQFNNIYNYTSYIKLDGDFFFLMHNNSGFDTTLIIP